VRHFWNWTQFRDYCQFILCISLLGFGATYLLKKVTVFIELLGFASLMTEAMLGVPQFWKNYQNKSVQGMRYIIRCCVMCKNQQILLKNYFLIFLSEVYMHSACVCVSAYLVTLCIVFGSMFAVEP